MTDSPQYKILYVDDTEAQRYAVSRILRHAGFEVLETSTGTEALEALSARPDLVVLDVNLPDINGIEVCKRIKANGETANLPVLQVSATSINAQARVAGLEGGADAYLVQPLDPNELIATIRALLRARKAEELLWKTQSQYRHFFDANPLPCFVFDTSDLRVLAVNPAAVQQYGYSKEEFTNFTLQDIFGAHDGSTVGVRSGVHQTKDGEVFDVEMVWAPLELEGKTAGLVIVQDVTERLQRQKAEKSEEIRRLLLARALQIQEDERRRIARELHDEAGQLMTTLLVGLRTLRDSRKLSEAKIQAKRLREVASNAIGELNRLAQGLHPIVLDELGFEAAVRRYAEIIANNHKIEVKLELTNDSFPPFTGDEQLNLYRIVQEALTNVARHSRAKHVVLKIDTSDSELRVTIRDDGRGISESSSGNPASHLGIEGMRQRALTLGGTLELVSQRMNGVTIDLRIPIKRSGKPEIG